MIYTAASGRSERHNVLQMAGVLRKSPNVHRGIVSYASPMSAEVRALPEKEVELERERREAIPRMEDGQPKQQLTMFNGKRLFMEAEEYMRCAVSCGRAIRRGSSLCTILTKPTRPPPIQSQKPPRQNFEKTSFVQRQQWQRSRSKSTGMPYAHGYSFLPCINPIAVPPLTDYKCYIAHRTMTRAIELYQKTYPGASQDNITFLFHPFYRSPDAPTSGIPWDEAVARKNGPERLNAIRTRMERVGRENGILFSFGSRIGSTRDCHRMVLHFARPLGPETEQRLIEQIFAAHFEGDADITSHAALAQMAVKAGVCKDEAEVLAFLGSGEGGEEVDRLVERARGKGVIYVPTLKIGRRKIEGAEEAGVFYEALVAAREGSETGEGTRWEGDGGEAC